MDQPVTSGRRGKPNTHRIDRAMTETPRKKRGPGRPSIGAQPGIRRMVALPQAIVDELCAGGDGSLSRGIVRMMARRAPKAKVGDRET